jgi:hypothetical protein
MWLIPKNGFPNPTATPFARHTPTMSDVAKPGPIVAATASTSDHPTPASSIVALSNGPAARK